MKIKYVNDMMMGGVKSSNMYCIAKKPTSKRVVRCQKCGYLRMSVNSLKKESILKSIFFCGNWLFENRLRRYGVYFVIFQRKCLKIN
jgi:hypothetical protein